jgi:hypothetical protein
MVRIILHALILPAMIWLERHGAPRLYPVRAALAWYLLGIPFMIVEASVSGHDWPKILLQSLIIALFFLPAAYFAFRYSSGGKRGIWKPFLLFLLLSLVSGFAAAAVLARAPTVRGIDA